MKIGVLALQGDFIEHQKILEKLGCQVVQVRLPKHLKGLDGLIIPGGESTTIGKMATDFGLMEPLKEFARKHAVWGHLRRGNFHLEGYSPPAATAEIDGFAGGAQCLRAAGGQFRD